MAGDDKEKRRVYEPRLVGDKVMMPADLKRLHKYMLEVEHIDLVFNYRHHVAAYPPGRVHRAVPPNKN